MNDKKHCANFNHGKLNPPISFCPNCGEKFSSQISVKRSCDDEKHKADRKNRSLFCTDCGKNLSKT